MVEVSKLEIEMWQVEYAVRKIQRALTRVKDDRFTPASLSSEISDYLIDLTVRQANGNSDFSKFVISLPLGAIEDELLKQVIPERHRQKMVGYRSRHKALEIEKEDYCVDQNFEKAAVCRDQQQEIAQLIRNLIADQEIAITPALVDSTLRSLGYNGSDESNR